MATVFWFRRDLRLQDNKALTEAVLAAKASGVPKVAGVYLLDNVAFEKLSGIRQHSLAESLSALSQSMAGNLSIKPDSAQSLIEISKEIGASVVFATESFEPGGIERQLLYQSELRKAGLELKLIDSNYAVSPGRVRKLVDGSPYRVYTPFYKAWLEVGWEAPIKLPAGFEWEKAKKVSLPIPNKNAPYQVRAGEKFALETFARFSESRLYDYADKRDRADTNGTSKLSFALAHGEIHPRTLLAELGSVRGHEVFRKEIAWREFYADVLFHNQHTVTDYYDSKFKNMRYDSGPIAEEKFQLWKQGRTGFPMVDAGMRQLLAEGWMHNRVRMIAASFLVKDLHLEWQLGAQWFEENLADFDVASNSHGWQWTAGCGTDASPYFRVFNPILQGLKFDPNGDYVRKYLPELVHIPGPEVHEPWKLIDGLVNGYPAPMLDHAQERDESLRRLEELKVK